LRHYDRPGHSGGARKADGRPAHDTGVPPGRDVCPGRFSGDGGDTVKDEDGRIREARTKRNGTMERQTDRHEAEHRQTMMEGRGRSV
jgi:hypothetical protein